MREARYDTLNFVHLIPLFLYQKTRFLTRCQTRGAVDLMYLLDQNYQQCFENAASPSGIVPTGSPSSGGDVAVYVFDVNQPNFPHSFLFCSRVCFCLYGPFNCISFHIFSQQLSAFSLCFPGLISALSVLSTIYLSTNVSLSPDIILCG